MKNLDLPGLVNGWTIGGALAVAGCLLLATLVSIGWTGPRRPGEVGFAPADITMIAPPTATMFIPSPTLDPLLAGSATPPVGQIGLNGYVQITGTEGEGLRIRSAPGLNSDTVFRGEESEVFQVRQGPEQADGYTWWYVVAPYDETRAGWAASDFLAEVPSP